jgi:hypothetical protein
MANGALVALLSSMIEFFFMVLEAITSFDERFTLLAPELLVLLIAVGPVCRCLVKCSNALNAIRFKRAGNVFNFMHLNPRSVSQLPLSLYRILICKFCYFKQVINLSILSVIFIR